MRKVLMLLLLGAVAVFAAGAIGVQDESSPMVAAPLGPDYVPLRSGDGAGYYFWDSQETDNWAPSYNWRTPRNPRGWRGDDTYWNLTTPFDIRFCGNDYPSGSSFYVGSNGILGFYMTDMDEPINQNIPDGVAPNSILTPLWDNLHGYADGDIYVEVAGSSPTQKWCISYTPWYFYNAPSDPIEFQVMIFQAPVSNMNNTIEFRYKDVVGDTWRDHGLSATVGLEKRSGTDAAKYSYNEEVIPNQFAIRFVDSNYVDDQVGEFDLLTPPDGSEYEPGDTIHFTWEAAEYSGHGSVNYTLYLADNNDFDDPVIFERGGATWLDYIFGDDDRGGYWWKVKAKETELGLTVWSEVWTFDIAGAVEETTWGQIKASY